MKASTEMKLLTLDELLGIREQIIKLQDALGMDTGIFEEGIKINKPEELEDLAGYLKADIKVERSEIGKCERRSFSYKGIEFCTYEALNKETAHDKL